MTKKEETDTAAAVAGEALEALEESSTMSTKTLAAAGEGSAVAQVQVQVAVEDEAEEAPDEETAKLMAKLNLSHADIIVYGHLWEVVDPEGTGYVVAKEAVMFFKKSGLTVAMLRAIWEESDKEPPLGTL